ncbi:MAG: IS1182 family transposase [Bradyrhizobium sp.]|uniref:IS1182 family transposase n=1 Tax=Bradyrhizobium sp. TaxID=376 RepID=UPI001DE32783|nr:IS1182 family transposase [Bradyrhizobium sp.]MBV9560944.1 IS1182 family transposase [Bradyrhizobium sp.]
MSLRPQAPPAVPEETRRVARAAFPKGTLCLRIADALGPVYQDGQFAAHFPRRGQPAAAPGRLALATVLQFVENLSDREAADAVRGRIDWKYALGLTLSDPGFDHTVLSEFRTRLVAGGAERLLLDTLLQRLQEQGLVKARGRQRTDSTHVLAAVRMLNRLERVGETLRAALNELATVAPEWLQALAPPDWYERYGRRVENYRLPKTEAARAALAAEIGADGQFLLDAIDAATEQPELVRLPKVAILRQVWAAQYAEETGRLRWRETDELPPCAEQVCSPYDPDARYSTKREADWIGYKAQLTETCDPACAGPHLIINVETTPATTPDDNMVAVVHASLERRGLLPSEHLVDKGYTDSHVLVGSQRRYDISIIGPVANDPSWQAREGGLTKAAFRVDWERKVVTCPAGHESISWLPNTWPKNGMIWEARFARRDCTPCPLRPRCTRAKREPRIIGLQAREHFEALQGARRHQETEAFRASYVARAGIEGTHAQAISRCGLRRSRYIGLAKTHLQHVITAAAVNLVRVTEWLAGTPVARTRVSRFAALRPAA